MIFLLIIFGIFPLIPLSVHAQSCNEFRQCDDLGRSAKESGNLTEALTYYQKACFMEVKKPFLNLRNNACLSVTKISGDLDNYASAYSFFNQACHEGKDTGCFHLALLEYDRGNLEPAMKMMKPLCDKNFIIAENVYSNACTEYKQIKSVWKVQHPRQPRDSNIQMPVFLVTLVLPLIATVFLFLKRYYTSLTLSILGFLAYGYYEYGVSPFADIRIDLLVILPALLLNLVILIVCVVKLVKNKPQTENDTQSS